MLTTASQINIMASEPFWVFFTDGSEIRLSPCDYAVKDNPCNLTCTTPDFSQSIDILCNGTSRGSCSSFGCSADVEKEGTNMLHLKILSLSYSMHLCEWSCTYGVNTSNKFNLTIYSKYTLKLLNFYWSHLNTPIKSYNSYHNCSHLKPLNTL